MRGRRSPPQFWTARTRPVTLTLLSGSTLLSRRNLVPDLKKETVTLHTMSGENSPDLELILVSFVNFVATGWIIEGHCVKVI